MWPPYVIEKFNSFVPQGLDSDECWIWLGKDVTGHPNYPKIVPYGRFYIPGLRRRIYAHRMAWEIANQQNVPEKMVICHHCDTPLCVNPKHLFLGTHKENTADMTKKNRHAGRFVTGVDARRRIHEEHHAAKLTQAQADEIRALYESTRHLSVHTPGRYSFVSLAKQYGVSKKTILNIVHNRIWLEQE